MPNKIINHSLPVIAYSVGEPAGIGPDLAVKLAQIPRDAHLLAIADRELLLARAELLKLPLRITDYPTTEPGELWLRSITLRDNVQPGRLNPKNAQYVLEGVTEATLMCLQGNADAMLTGPVHKGVMNQAGIAFTGHTEWIANLCGASHVVMMLVNDNLRVALVTAHIPIKEVAAAITEQALDKTISIVHRELNEKFAMTNPRIAICGLNPHAGENGYIGREEIETMLPLIKRFKAEGINITGPLPADSVFCTEQRAEYDVIIALYHDQGLAPFKALSFGGAVNVTLGLPIIRTSVDHGTALDLAGTGKALVGSLIAAMNLARDLAIKRQEKRV